MTAPATFILLDFDEENFSGQQRFFTESYSVCEAFVAICYSVVVREYDVFTVVWMKSGYYTSSG